MSLDSAIQYVQSSMGITATVMEWENTLKLPAYISVNYKFRKIRLFDRDFILSENSFKEDLSLDQIKKHFAKIKENNHIDDALILVLNQPSDYLRKQLIEASISFIIPGKQIFIPELGTAYNERQISKFSRTKTLNNEKMTPTAQSLFLFLMATLDFSLTMEQIALILNKSKMSISRGFKELNALGVIVEDNNENNKYKFNKSSKEIWEYTQKFLFNPIMRTVYINTQTIKSSHSDELTISGESALSRLTMLVGPEKEVYGVSNERFKSSFSDVLAVPYKDNNTVTIQLFRHELLSMNGVLHPLAIAVVLKDEFDERVTSELKHMINEYFNVWEDAWVKDIRLTLNS